jgi:hypothetical protein
MTKYVLTKSHLRKVWDKYDTFQTPIIKQQQIKRKLIVFQHLLHHLLSNSKQISACRICSRPLASPLPCVTDVPSYTAELCPAYVDISVMKLEVLTTHECTLMVTIQNTIPKVHGNNKTSSNTGINLLAPEFYI